MDLLVDTSQSLGIRDGTGLRIHIVGQALRLQLEVLGKKSGFCPALSGNSL